MAKSILSPQFAPLKLDTPMPHTNTRNTIRMIVVALAASVFALADAREARAAVVTFSDLGSFLTALDGSSRTTETYLSVPATTLIGNGTSLNGLTYSFTAGPYSSDFGGAPTAGRISANFNAWGTPGVPDNSLGANRPNPPPFDPNANPQFVSRDGATQFLPGELVTVTANRRITAIGAFFNADPRSADGDVFITLPQLGATAGNKAGTSVVDPNFPARGNTLFFVGLISDTPFTQASFGARDYGNTNQGTLFTLSNLITAPAAAVGAVPEPGTLAVFGGLALVGLAARRKRAASPPATGA